MSGHREWMYRPWYENCILNPQFLEGLQSFIHFACSQPAFIDREKIKCPSKKCDNVSYRRIEVDRYLILKNGFVRNYHIWRYQGEMITRNHEDMMDHDPSSTYHTTSMDHACYR